MLLACCSFLFIYLNFVVEVDKQYEVVFDLCLHIPLSSALFGMRFFTCFHLHGILFFCVKSSYAIDYFKRSFLVFLLKYETMVCCVGCKAHCMGSF